MPQTVREIIKQLPFIMGLLDTDIWRMIRHRSVLHFDRRDQAITFTRFIRLPTQYEALAGPVLQFLTADQTPGQSLRIAVLGCSNGAEAYSVASTLSSAMPALKFDLFASDINSEVVEKARAGRYTRANVYDNKIMRNEFVEATFNNDGEAFLVKPEIAKRARFEVADALSPELPSRLGECDIVFAQNFLFNLPRKLQVKCFENIVRLLKARSALFIEGMDYDLRSRLTRQHGLKPLDFKIKEIHEDALSERAAGWPYRYWGLEPFTKLHLNWRRRYATIFLRGA